MSYILNYNGWKREDSNEPSKSVSERFNVDAAKGITSLVSTLTNQTPTATTANTSTSDYIKYGSRGEDVKTIQAALVNLNYSLPVSGIDGIFGPETQAAVKSFQKENSLPITGEVDIATLNSLASGNAKGPAAPVKSDTTYAKTINKNLTDYDKVVDLVIDKLEQGYYHPNMRKREPVKFKKYGTSGETMFGLDRHAGHDLYYSTPRKEDSVTSDLKNIESGKYQYKTPEAAEFWKTIDSANAKNTWAWNYKGGPLASKLRVLAGKIMKPVFESFLNKYLTNKAKDLVLHDGRLLFHFIYATWNGEGWFRKFARDINKAVEGGVKNPDVLIQIAMDSRTKEGLADNSAPNSLIAQGGEKIKTLIGV